MYTAWRKLASRPQGSGGGFSVPTTLGAFPIATVLDNFNRADEGPPPSTSWTSDAFGSDAGLKVLGNQLATSTVASSAYWNVASFGPNCEVYATIASTSEVCELFARLSNPGTGSETGYMLASQGTADFILYRVDTGGALTQLGATFSQASVANGDSFGMRLVGSSIEVYYKPAAGSWTSLGTRIDGTYGGSGRVAARAIINANTAFLDDFGGGTI